MANTISPNMSLIIPGVGSEAGPTYAVDVNASLTLIDQHDHSPGKGVQITPAGLNLNVNVDFKGNSAYDLLAATFTPQASPSSTLDSLSVAPGIADPSVKDLYYTDSNGTQIQITQNGTVLAPFASVQGINYPTANSVLAFQFTEAQSSLPSVVAALNSGPLTINLSGAATTSTHNVTLAPTGSISSAYTLLLPNNPSLLAGNSFVTINKSTNQLEGTILTTEGITGGPGGNIAAGTITSYNLDVASQQFNTVSFVSSGSFVVPAGVTSIIAKAVGGGGGGGGGSNSITGGGSFTGGGGGAGSNPVETILNVTPGETLTVQIGVAGGGGAGGFSPSNGTNGGATKLLRSGTPILQVMGGQAGQGGINAAPGGAGGYLGNGLLTAGGSGGSGAVGGNGQESFEGNGGVGGTNTTGAIGGGGGGGAGWGGGAAGGNTETNGGTVTSAWGSGGGGGGAGDNTHPAGNGGNGGIGRLDIYYLG